MKTHARRYQDAKHKLDITRAQLRAIRQYAAPDVALQAKPGPPQFIQCWAVQRGGFSAVTQALDSAGQVWERVSLMGEEIIADKKVKVLKDSWWMPISMERREAAKETAE